MVQRNAVHSAKKWDSRSRQADCFCSPCAPCSTCSPCAPCAFVQHCQTTESPWLWATKYLRWRTVHFLTTPKTPCAAPGGHISMMSMNHVNCRNQVDAQSPCCRWSPCWCSWSTIHPEAMLMSMVRDAARGSVDVHGPCYHRLLWTKKLLSQWYRWLQTGNWEWETLRASVTPSPSKEKKQCNRKTCDKDVDV